MYFDVQQESSKSRSLESLLLNLWETAVDKHRLTCFAARSLLGECLKGMWFV